MLPGNKSKLQNWRNRSQLKQQPVLRLLNQNRRPRTKTHSLNNQKQRNQNSEKYKTNNSQIFHLGKQKTITRALTIFKDQKSNHRIISKPIEGSHNTQTDNNRETINPIVKPRTNPETNTSKIDSTTTTINLNTEANPTIKDINLVTAMPVTPIGTRTTMATIETKIEMNAINLTNRTNAKHNPSVRTTIAKFDP